MKYEIIKNTIPSGIKRDLRITGRNMELAVERGLEVMRSSTLPFVPVKTGRLKGSIATRIGKDSIYNVESESGKQMPRQVRGILGTNVEYAKAVEFGTSKRRGRYYLTRGVQAAKEPLKLVIFNTLRK